ncbi:MAG: PIG-L family deacetylase [Desulfamplus sp.]|nr:PIG-L family deacetylase [Desulfamplus sp.]
MNKPLFLSACLIAALIFTLIIYIMGVRTSAYPYKTSADYNYDFTKTDAQIFKLQLHDSKFKTPVLGKDSYSAFLKVKIESTFLGRFFEPEAQLISESEQNHIFEYFENSASGIRYINISPLISKFESEYQIEIKGKRAIFKDQTLELILFKNQDITRSKILIIAPHPDDAEIAAFGLYSSSNRFNNSQNIYIITITAGDAGTYQYDEIYSNKESHFIKKGKLRTWNSLTVPLLGGVPPENIINLGFFDGTLQKMFENNPNRVKALYTQISDINFFREQNTSELANTLEGEASWNSLVKNLMNLIIKIEPDIIVAPYPAIDKHPDHKFSSIALFDSIKMAATRQSSSHDIRRGYLYLYTNHLVLNEYYPYGKMGSVISLPPAFDSAIYFKTIYSHYLSNDRQSEKILSLEAMNDLRLDTSWRFSIGAIKMAIASVKRDIMGKNVSYYRRAVRSNELFFVIPISDIYNQAVVDKIR